MYTNMCCLRPVHISNSLFYESTDKQWYLLHFPCSFELFLLLIKQILLTQLRETVFDVSLTTLVLFVIHEKTKWISTFHMYVPNNCPKFPIGSSHWMYLRGNWKLTTIIVTEKNASVIVLTEFPSVVIGHCEFPLRGRFTIRVTQR